MAKVGLVAGGVLRGTSLYDIVRVRGPAYTGLDLG